jgi:hypothetical protein
MQPVKGAGFLRSLTSGTRFRGQFTMTDGQSYIIAGSFSSAILPFKSDTATLTFQTRYSLRGTKYLSGVVGRDKFVINIGDGRVLERTLEASIITEQTVVGAASFTEP